ncbi:MAG TPA: hypothetical protein VF230_01970 [Acidimicrobiales bacterium]
MCTVVLIALTLVTPASPVSAADKPDVHLPLGVPVVVEDTLPPIPGYAISRRAEAAPTPENCTDGGTADSYCYRYKVHLDIPRDVQARGGVLFSLLLEWDEGRELVTNPPQLGGSLYERAVIMRVYEEPKFKDENDTETYTAASGLNSGSPSGLAVVDPNKAWYWVLVANYYGANTKFKLTLRVDDLVGSGSPIDLSAEEELPPLFDASELPAEQPSLVEPPPAATLAAPKPTAVVASPATDVVTLPSLPGLGAPDFSLDGIGASSLGEEDLTDVVLTRGPKPLPAPGDASALLLLIWLVLAPMLLLGLPVGFVWRRRREEAAAT